MKQTMWLNKQLLFGSFSIFFISLATASSRAIYTSAQEEQFVEKYSEKYDIPENYMRKTLSLAVFQQKTYNSEQRHHVTVNPPQSISYRKVKVSPALVRAGQKFMCQHQKTLAKAHATYGVPPSYIVGILGMETLYGRFVGNYRAVDTLTTLAFNSPERTDFFQDELAQFIVMCYKNDINPASVISSIDGGIGISQFMPSSYMKFAVSANDNAPDLFTPEDAIMSVAHYLKQHNWRTSAQNFEAIYSYNHSVKYTMKVYQLGIKVAKQTSRSGC